MFQRARGGKKKLADAARHWAARPASSAADDDGRAADPDGWQDAIEAASERIDGGDEDGDGRFVVWPENIETLNVFLALNRCWRVGELNGRHLGLDRPSIESTLRLMQIPRKRHAEIFGDLRIMEHAALEVLNRGQ